MTRVTRSRKVVVLAVLALVAVLVQRVIASHDSASPYPASAVHASVRLHVVAPDRAQNLVDQLAGHGRLTAVRVAAATGRSTPSEIVGQLTFRTPHNATSGDEYALFVIDSRAGSPVPLLFGAGPVGSNVGQGWESQYGAIARRYDWLRMLASVPDQDGSGYTDPGMAVSFPADTHGPITFNAVLAPDSLPITDPAHQLTLALVLLGANGDIHWATRLEV